MSVDRRSKRPISGDGAWDLRRLDVLDRAVADLARLGESVEDLSIQAAPRAELDLGRLPKLWAVAGDWGLIGSTLNELGALRDVITWRFDEIDLHAFRDHVELRRLTIEDAPHLESLDGIGNLPELAVLEVVLAYRLRDIGEIAGLSSSLRRLKLQDCRSVDAIDAVEPLVNLRFLGVSNCGEVESFAPLEALHNLENHYAWGSTRVVDGDLSSLARLPRLTEIRMRPRRTYRPPLADVQALLSDGNPA